MDVVTIGDLWRIWRAKRRVERAVAMGWDWQKSAQKAGISLGKHALTVLIAAACLVPDSAVRDWLLAADVPPGVVVALVPALMAAVRYYGNRAKHLPPGEPQ